MSADRRLIVTMCLRPRAFLRPLAVVVAMALMPIAVTHADPIDDDFVQTLADNGVIGDPAALVATAHTVCGSASGAGVNLPAGLTMMLPLGYVMSSLKLPVRRATFVVNTAIDTYCPQLRGTQNQPSATQNQPSAT